MEAFKRKADLSVKKSMTLPDGTSIDVVGISARKTAEISNNKRLSDFDRGIHVTAAKIHVNGQEVCYDDLLDCFTDKELTKIVKFANDLIDDETPKNE
jgi:hypothetical protein